MLLHYDDETILLILYLQYLLHLYLLKIDIECSITRTNTTRYDTSLIMVQQKDVNEYQDGSFSFFAFSRPLSLESWLMFALAIFVTGATCFIIEYLLNKDRSVESRRRLSEAAFSLMSRGNYESNYYGSIRMINLSMNLLSILVFLATYTANLASFMVVNNKPTVQINDLNDAVISSKMICYWGGTSQERFFKARYPDYPNQYAFSAGSSEFTLFELIQEGKCEIGLTEITAFNSAKRDFSLNKDCNLEWVGRVVDIGFASFPIATSTKYWLVPMV